MRPKRSRVKWYSICPRVTKKDNEGSSYEEYSTSFSVLGEVWSASSKLQVEMYGERVNTILNCHLFGAYQIVQNESGQTEYVCSNGSLKEGDGMCVYVGENESPDYRIISVKPYREYLTLEVEKL